MVKNNENAFRSIIRMTTKIKGLTLLAVIISIFVAGFNAAQPPVLQGLLDSVTQSPVFWGATLAALVILQSIFASVLSYVQARINQSLIRDLQSDLSHSVFNMPLEHLEQYRRGDVLSRFNSDSTEVAKAVNSGIISAIGSISGFVFAFIGMIWIDLPLLLVILVCIAFGVLTTVLTSRGVQDRSRLVQDSTGTLTSCVERTMSALPLIRAYNATDHEVRRIKAVIQDLFQKSLSLALMQAAMKPIATITMQIALMAALAFGVFRVTSGVLTIGGLVAFVMYLMMMINPVMQIMNGITTIRTGSAAMDRIETFLEADSEESYQARKAVANLNKFEITENSSIEFRKVEYIYRNGEEKTYIGPLNFCIPSGTKTAIVGPSGSGKSTVLSLLERFRLPNNGSIFIEGQHQLSYELSSYRDMFSLVDQASIALGGTLRENFSLVGSIEDSDIFSVLESTGLGRLNNRLDNDLGDDAVKLSGGERQRLAWGRLILANNRPIVLLDEPVSSVDAVSANLLNKVISSLPDSTTVLLVTHYLSHAKNFDQILVMKDGKIISSGTHNELLDTCDDYRVMAQLQGVT